MCVHTQTHTYTHMRDYQISAKRDICNGLCHIVVAAFNVHLWLIMLILQYAINISIIVLHYYSVFPCTLLHL